VGNSVGGVGVLDKAVEVLSALEERPRSLAELVDVTGLPRATAHRLAKALESHGLVRREPDGRFALGTRLIALGRVATDGLPLAQAASEALLTLRDSTGESVQLFIREGDRRVCIAALQSLHGLRTIVPLGASLPLDAGSAGKVLSELQARASEGWVQSVGEREAGVASVSAPICDSNGLVVAAVSVSGPIERITRQPGRQYGSVVASAARQIEVDAGLRLEP
jgi:DNA-binding IclR family transcriptional regulator